MVASREAFPESGDAAHIMGMTIELEHLPASFRDFRRDDAIEQKAFLAYQQQNHDFPGKLPTWAELAEDADIKWIYRAVHYRPWNRQLLGGSMDLRGTDADTTAALLESLALGFAATGQLWQITRFFHIPPHGIHPGHIFLRLEWGVTA